MTLRDMAKGYGGCEIVAGTDAPETLVGDALVVFLAEKGRPPVAIDSASGGQLSRLIEAGEFVGRRNECVSWLAPPGLRVGQVVLVGTGPRGVSGGPSRNARDPNDCGACFQAAATAARHLAARPRGHVLFLADPAWEVAEQEQAVAGGCVGMIGQDLYRAEKKRTPFGRATWLGIDAATVARGATIGEGVNLARRLVNTAPADCYPESFAEEAVAVASRLGLEVEVWDADRLARERCGALLAVARGSARPPRLVLLRTRGGRSEGPPALALVGKGVTFDSGGLSLKPSDSMLTMKCDMSGGAAVLATIATIAALEIPIDVVAAIGLVENMTGAAAYKLGDVLTARNGTTIEVHNTDAEGRLVLADVLDVVRELAPRRIVDVATLTGACVVALGTETAGLFTNDQAWCDRVAAAARAVGEPVWQLPMDPEFGEQIKGEVADIKNVGDGRWGGAITAAKFLERFVGQTPWTHVDIAGPAFAEKPRPWTDGGGTGAMVRALTRLAADEATA
jgi:leucyl aminopeptidase